MTVAPRRECGGRGPRTSAAAALVLALIALLLAGCGSDLPPRGVISDNPDLALPPLPASAEAEADEQVADPVRVRIPAIGGNAAVGPLEVDETGVLPPPDTNEDTGWWRAGPEPGERGPAVIVGHVDSYQGPSVFVRLHQMRAARRSSWTALTAPRRPSSRPS